MRISCPQTKVRMTVRDVPGAPVRYYYKYLVVSVVSPGLAWLISGDVTIPPTIPQISARQVSCLQTNFINLAGAVRAQ